MYTELLCFRKQMSTEKYQAFSLLNSMLSEFATCYDDQLLASALMTSWSNELNNKSLKRSYLYHRGNFQKARFTSKTNKTGKIF